MDHSLYGYLSRQDTQVLERVLREYLEMEPSRIQGDTVAIIQDILRKREKGESRPR